MSRKVGFHSGVLHAQDVEVKGDLYVQDDIVFSDVSAGVLGVTGGIDMSGTTSAVGIDMSGTFSTTAIKIGGTYDKGIQFAASPQAGDNTNSFINIGDYGTALAVAPTTDNMFGVMHNVSLTDVNVAYWYQAYYTKITTSGTTTDTSIAGHALRMVVGSSLGAVYGIQCHTNITATNTCATEIISVSAYVNLGSGATTTTDRVCALQAMIEGAGGDVTGDSVVAYLVNAGTASDTDAIVGLMNQSACTVTDGIRIENDGTMTSAIKMKNDAAVTNFIEITDATKAPYSSTDISGNIEQGHLVVKIGSNTYGIPLYSTT